MPTHRNAIFPGSFDPITLAHLELINRAIPLFDSIYVVIGKNSSKTPHFPLDVRLAVLEKIFKKNPTIKVGTYEGLTVDFAKSVGANYILRGMRNTTDFEFENAIAKNNLQLAPQIESVFLLSGPGYGHISSTIVRDILKNKGNIAHLVPREVLPHI